ncbi:hypothetical protein [Streptomyces anulatus]|uniref:hypothetical protein n=1 Tax=Streptomyces anulatus TaxID=1892 RepID=UPI003715F345
MSSQSEPTVANADTAPTSITISLSGGGYRAAVFAAGSLLAVADSSLRPFVTSVSSVSGGSITSAVTVGGFAEPTIEMPDPMGQRVRLLAGLVQSRAIATESLLRLAKLIPLAPAAVLLLFLAFPDWRSTESVNVFTTSLLALLFTGMILFVFGGQMLTAFPRSWYAVQRAVESLVSHVRGTLESRAGTTLAEISEDESTRRIFCTTDLSEGSHVYFTPGRVLGPNVTGRDPSVFLADIVAASACFPGFRPLTFRRSELGLSGVDPVGPARVHHVGRRFLVGFAGFIGICAIASALTMRIVGPLSGNEDWADKIPILAGILLGGAILAGACAWSLRSQDNLALVDGGVCDNLGTAFALLAKDNRYPALANIAGTDQKGLILVVDASQPFTSLKPGWRGLGELVPLRVQGAQRSVLKLLGNANSAARKHVIQFLLSPGSPTTGAVVSIQQVPSQDDGQDYSDLTERTTRVKTTLDALANEVVRDLLLQSYRLTQSVLVTHGVTLTVKRSEEQLNLLAEPNAGEIAMIYEQAKGPYARKDNKATRNGTVATVLLGFVITFCLMAWAILR